MKPLFRSLATSTIALVTTQGALAEPVLPPGSMIVASTLPRELVVLDRAGEVLSRIDAKHDSNFKDVVVGPDGRIHLIYEKSIVVLGDELAPLFTITNPSSASSGAIGPNGHLFVTESYWVREYDRTGKKVGETPFGEAMSGIDLAFGPDGLLYVVRSGIDPAIDIVDPAGRMVGSLAPPEMKAPTGLAFAPDGHLWIAQATTVNPDLAPLLVLDTAGNVLHQYGIGDGVTHARMLCFGPDGLVYVTDYLEDRVFRFTPDGVLVDSLAEDAGLDYPYGISFAPYRFEAKIRGRVRRNGADDEKLKEHGTLSISPGSRTAMLWLDPEEELAALLGSAAVVVHGFEAFEDDEDEKRHFHGAERAPRSLEDGIASLAFEMRGDVEDDGHFEVEKAKGTLHVASAAAVFIGKVRTDDLLD